MAPSKLARHLKPRAWRKRRQALPYQIAIAIALVAITMLVNAQHTQTTTTHQERRLDLANANDTAAVESDTNATSAPANNLYPQSPFTLAQMRSGAVVLHLICLIYMFSGIAVVCDGYFVTALELISARLQISDDVAGATFMAAGGSAPELMTNIVGTFLIVSDVGIGTIVGSAVFNVLFVIGLCAYFSGFEKLTLSWYPLMRDSIFYLVCLGVLLGFLADSEIRWYDATVLLCLYLVYVLIMCYDARVKQKIVSWEARYLRISKSGRFLAVDLSAAAKVAPAAPAKDDENAAAPTASDPSVVSTDDEPEVAPRSFSKPHRSSIVDMPSAALTKTAADAQFRRKRATSSAGHTDASAASDDERPGPQQRAVSVVEPGPECDKNSNAADGDKANEDEVAEEEDLSSWKWPEWPESNAGRLHFVVMAPLLFAIAATVPDCSLKRLERYYALSFGMSITWIAALTYVMVWMATEIGDTIGIPPSVMGVTVLAAGTSIPDAISSVIVAREGHGDMALSSSIGSNVFDITFGLPVPWLLGTLAVFPLRSSSPFGSGVIKTTSAQLGVQVGTLMLMVVAVITSIHTFGWTINKQLGILYFVLYALFLVEAVLLECLVGRTCSS